MQKKSYISLYPFQNDFFKYTIQVTGSDSISTGVLTPVGGTNCPKGRFLYETGRKLFPGVHPNVNTYMVSVYDPVSILNGFIDPNSKVFSPMNTDKPYSAQILNNINGIFGINPNGNTESDKGPGVFTLANSEFGANVNISSNLTVNGNTTLGDLTVNNLTIRGNATQIDMTDLSSEQFSITNNGTGPAFTVNQLGSSTIANFLQDSNSVLFLRDGGNIGINTITPNFKLEVNGTFNANTIYQNGFVLVPPGSLMMYIASSAPAGWLLCDGTAVSRVTYSALFSIIGTTYGAGDGLTTFQLPDTRGRTLIGGGTGAGLTARSIGQLGGAETHTLTTLEMPSHTHTGTTNSEGLHSHTHNANAEYPGSGLVYRNGQSTREDADSGQANEINLDTARALSIDSNGAHTHTFTSASTGGGNAHTIMQPFLVVNYIIKY
jgi:microcystin-dependent protein